MIRLRWKGASDGTHELTYASAEAVGKDVVAIILTHAQGNNMETMKLKVWWEDDTDADVEVENAQGNVRQVRELD